MPLPSRMARQPVPGHTSEFERMVLPPSIISSGRCRGRYCRVVRSWNYYNRVNTSAIVQNNNPSWTYSVSAWRPSDNSTSMRVSFVTGFAEDSIDSAFYALNSNSGGYGGTGVGN